MTLEEQIRALINRLARLDAAGIWEVDLNPAQIAALDYLARANRFSRAPSHVADYLGTTRGTMSQTLKSLVRKGYLSESRSDTDRRSIVYDVTATGRALAQRQTASHAAISALAQDDKAHLAQSLAALLTAQLASNGGRAFGLCKTCSHHRQRQDGAYCALLSLSLLPQEADQLCHEHHAL